MLSISRVANADYYIGGPGSCGCGTDAHTDDGGPAEYRLGAVASGEPPGEWLVFGENPLNLSGEITTEGPAGDKFRKLVNHLQNPDTGEQLGRAPINAAMSPQDRLEDRVKRWRRRNPMATPEDEAAYRAKTAADNRVGVTGWDCVFSVPKSWSVLWSAYQWAGRTRDADLLWQAIDTGVRAALQQLFEELAFTRHGTAGPEQADGSVTTDYRAGAGLVTALFKHHVSRERDPNLHVHVMVLNRLLTESGAWHALYSGALLRAKVQLDATFQRVIETEARRLLGLSFVRNPDTPWREIEGVSVDIRDHFSSRSRALSEEAEKDVAAFQDMYGVAPNARQRWQIRQRAVLNTRRRKDKDAPSPVEEVERWARETEQTAVRHFEDVLDTVDEMVALTAEDEVPEFDPVEVIAQGVADLEDESTGVSVFNYARLCHAISQRLPDHLDGSTDEVRALIRELAERAEREGFVVSTKAAPRVVVPASMRDRHGASRFDAPDSRKFTTPGALVREDALLARLDVVGARTVPSGTARAMLARTRLSASQATVAHDVLTSPRRLELVNAGAGVGKSVTVTAISEVTEQVSGSGVTAFTLSESAAMVLRREGLGRAHNIERFLNFTERAARGAVSDSERAQFAVPAGGVVVVDEASMVSTPLLTRLLAQLDEAGVGKVVLVGDVRQVDAVGPGGGFAMLVRESERRDLEQKRHGEPVATPRVHEMTEVRRFANGWEREASQGLRDGRVEVLADYEARGRVHGDQNHERVRDQAVAGFVADWVAGRDSVIVTGTAEQADDLSSRVRRQLIDTGHVDGVGAVQVRGHNQASVGDIVQSRLNARDTVGALNRDRWQIVATTDCGELHVRKVLGRHEFDDQVIVLPPDYVRRQVELAYSSTQHAVQGGTFYGGAHTLVSRLSGASHVYVGGSRGVLENHWYVELEDGETPIGRLSAIVGGDDHAKAGRDQIADSELREKSLGHLYVLWETAVRDAKVELHRDMLTDELGGQAGSVLNDPSSKRLFGLLRQAELDGHDPRTLVASVMGKRRAPISTADSPASLLYAQVSKEMETAGLGEPVPVSFENRVPAPRLNELESPERKAARRIGRLLDERAAELAEDAAVEVPEWALRAAGPVPVEVERRGAWTGRVKYAAALREAQGFTDQQDAIGRRPTHVEPERCWLYDQASRDLGLPDDQRELRAMSSGQLLNVVDDYRREERAVAPRFQGDDLRVATAARDEVRARMVDAVREGRDTVELEAQELAYDAEIERREFVAEKRRLWHEATADQRERAAEAQAELDRRKEVEAAERGVPLPEFAPDDPEREAELEREAAEGREVDARAAVFAWWTQQREQAVEGTAPAFGSREWHEGDDEARWRSAVDAAMQRYRAGEPIDRAELAERLAELEVDVDPWVELDPDDLRAMSQWVRSPEREDDGERLPPVALGSPEWAELEPGDPRRDEAVRVAAFEQWNLGDPLDAREQRLERAQDVASSHDIAEDLNHQREQARRQRVEQERVARIAEEQRAREVELRRGSQVSNDEMSVNGLAGAEMTWRDEGASPTEREIARLFLVSQGIDPQREEPVWDGAPVEWPQPRELPQPEREVEPEPEPSAVEAPEQVREPEPEQVAEPERDQDVEPVVEEPVREPAPEVVRDDAPELDRTTSRPAREPAPVEAEPVREAEPVEAKQPAEPQPEPEREPEPEPQAEPAPERDLSPVEAEPEFDREAHERTMRMVREAQAREEAERHEREACERAEREQREAQDAERARETEQQAKARQLAEDVERAERAAEVLEQRQAQERAVAEQRQRDDEQQWQARQEQQQAEQEVG